MRTRSCTPSAMGIYVPVREIHSRLNELLSDVVDRRDHILVTRNDKPAAALVPIDEYHALEENAETLCHADAPAAIDPPSPRSPKRSPPSNSAATSPNAGPPADPTWLAT